MACAQHASFNVVALSILTCLWFDLEFMSGDGGGCANLEWKLKKCTFAESF
jgi:hypothetical protein